MQYLLRYVGEHRIACCTSLADVRPLFWVRDTLDASCETQGPDVRAPMCKGNLSGYSGVAHRSFWCRITWRNQGTRGSNVCRATTLPIST